MPPFAEALPHDADAVFDKIFLTPEGRADPYPLYHQLREARPVHRANLGVWVLSRYDDCWAAMRDPRLGKDYAPQVEQRFGPDWRRHPSLTAGEHSMLNTTGPEHTRLRKLVTKAFTPRMIENLRPVIERVVNELLDPVAAAGGGNVLEAVGFPLPVTIIGEMLGVPVAERQQFRPLVRDLVAIFEMQPTDAQMAAADAAQLAIREYFLQLVAEKRRKPGEDLLSTLATVVVGDDRLTDDELVTLASLLFAAGFETTTNLFGNGLLALLRHPDQLALLRRDPSLFANLPDEFLRYDGSVQLVNRITEASVEVGGVTIPAGEQVFALLGAGNRDPARYANPDQLDVTRTNVQPLTFGGGVHFCLGAALARAEIEITFRTLIGRFEHIALAGAAPRFQDRLALRGLTALEVACRAASGSQAGVAVGRRWPRGQGRALPRPHRPSAGCGPNRATRAPICAGARSFANASRPNRHARIRSPSAPASASRPTVALLLRNGLFERCTKDELEQLAATAYPMTFEPGDLLCSEGGESPECYVIEEGQAVVTIGRKGMGVVGELGVVGEVGVLRDTVRAATVTATTHMITYAISRERLRAIVAGNAAARDWMLAEITRRYPNLG